MKYTSLSPEQKASIDTEVENRFVEETEPAVDQNTVAVWESSHYAHTLLLNKAKADENDEEIQLQESNLAILEKAITKAKANTTV